MPHTGSSKAKSAPFSRPAKQWVRLQRVGNGQQCAVGGGVADALVQALQVAQTQQQQPRLGRHLAVAEHAVEHGHEVAPIGQAGERVGVGLAAQCLQLLGLDVEQGLLPADQ